MSESTVCVSGIYDSVLPYLPGATTGYIDQVALSVFQEFCMLSAAWRGDAVPVDIDAGKRDYYLSPQADSNILLVLSVNIKSGAAFIPCAPLHERFVPAMDPTATGTPRYYAGDSAYPGKITLYPSPAEDIPGGLLVGAAMAPKLPWQKRIPASVFSEWSTVLADGIIGRAMLTPDKPWTNLVLAEYYLRRFRAGAITARSVARTGYTNAETPISFPRWA